jgi:hypothetical protein
LLHGKKAKLTPDRVGLYSHPDWVSAAERQPPPRLWTPRIPTETGLEQTAAWYREQDWLG